MRAYFTVRANLGSCSEFPGGQIMFLARGDWIRLASFQDGISRMGVSLVRGDFVRLRVRCKKRPVWDAMTDNVPM
jgi:hypothetical protein